MSRLLAKRQRLQRVRHIQHVLAVAETSRARDEAAHIENNGKRLAAMRGELFGDARDTIGATLASQRELAGRLEQAGRQIDGALYDAQRKIAYREQLAMAADRDREIAERLKDKAARAVEEKREARIAALPLHKYIQPKGQGDT